MVNDRLWTLMAQNSRDVFSKIRTNHCKEINVPIYYKHEKYMNVHTKKNAMEEAFKVIM